MTPTTSDNSAVPCPHPMLHVSGPLDAPAPICCAECRTLFDVPAAIEHIRTFNSTADPRRRAAVLLNYARAEYVDGDTCEYVYVMPDLDVDVGAAEKGYALEQFSDLVVLNLQERAAKGLMPPAPRDVKTLQEAFPSLAEWEWTTIAVSVTDYLAPDVEW